MLCGVPGTAFVAVILNVLLPGRNLKKQPIEEKESSANGDLSESHKAEGNLMGVEVDVSGLEAPKPGEEVSPIDFEAEKVPANGRK